MTAQISSAIDNHVGNETTFFIMCLFYWILIALVFFCHIPLFIIINIEILIFLGSL